MKAKHKLIIWIIIDVVLLILLLVAFAKWVEINNTLKNPCVACAKGTIKEECIKQASPFQFEINLTEINKNKIISNYT